MYRELLDTYSIAYFIAGFHKKTYNEDGHLIEEIEK
jgi:hypothetical protein